MGLHRFYLQEPLGLRLHSGFPRSSSISTAIFATRARTCRARARPSSAAHIELDRAQAFARRGRRRRRGKRALAARRRPRSQRPRPSFEAAQARARPTWHGYSRWLALDCAAMLVVRRASCCPAWCARQNAREADCARHSAAAADGPGVPPSGTYEDPTLTHAHPLHRRDRMGQRQRRRVRRLLGA